MAAENGTVVEQLLQCEIKSETIERIALRAWVPLRRTNGVLRYE
jgi:hypothetical protein